MQVATGTEAKLVYELTSLSSFGENPREELI